MLLLAKVGSKSLTARALLKYLPEGLNMTYDEYDFGENATNMNHLLGKQIGYIFRIIRKALMNTHV